MKLYINEQKVKQSVVLLFQLSFTHVIYNGDASYARVLSTGLKNT